MATTWLVPKNNVTATLANPLTSTQTELTVATGQGARFPSTFPFRALVARTEIVQCTSRTGDVLTIVREQEGTTAAASYPAGSSVQMTVTAGYMEQVQASVGALETGAGAHDALSVTGASTLTGAVTAPSASNAIRIGALCNMTTPPAIGATSPNTGKFTTLQATGKITGPAGTSSGAPLNIPQGVAPSAPVNGDIWTTSAGIYIRINGATIGPLISAATFPWATPQEIGSTTPNTGKFSNVTLTGSLLKAGDLQATSTPASGTGRVYLDVTAPTGSEAATVAAFRNTNTTGQRLFIIYKGDNTSTRMFSVNAETGAVTLFGPLTNAVVTFTANDTTPSVAGGNTFIVPGTWTAGNNITMFDDGQTGQTIRILGGDSDCVVVDGGNLKLAGNWTAAAGATLTLTMFTSGVWYEVGRTAT